MEKKFRTRFCQFGVNEDKRKKKLFQFWIDVIFETKTKIAFLFSKRIVTERRVLSSLNIDNNIIQIDPSDESREYLKLNFKR